MADEVKVTSFVPETIKGVGEGTLKAMIETAIKVVSVAKYLGPVPDTGRLRASIMWKSNTKDGGRTDGEKLTEPVAKNEVIVGTATEYAVYQEYGTRKMSAQPYLRPAVDIITNNASWQEAVKKAMNDSVRIQLGFDEVIL